jgi:uncharacterized cupredoxin-like copper-binding protein
MIWQFTKAGAFDFACLQPGHFEAGMRGKVAVKMSSAVNGHESNFVTE